MIKFNNITERNIFIGDIPSILLTPKDSPKPYPTILLYHGWSSDTEKQRFRGFILCSLGYQIIIPCAAYHGTRNPIDHSNISNAINYFWKVVINNIEESDGIISKAVRNFNADPHRIGVVGNSMGGFTSAGIFAKNKDIKAAVIFNGSCDWGCSNRIFTERLKNENTDIGKSVKEKISKYDPSNNLNDIINRPILLLHGDSDTTVSIEAQREFYKKALPLYRDGEKLSFIEYPKLNHFVTTNMMEEAAIWFGKYL